MRRLLFCCLLGAVCLSAQTPAGPSIPVIGDPTDFTEAYRLLVGQWQVTAERWQAGLFFSLALLDMLWFGITLWLDRHTLDTALMATTRKLITICFFLMLTINAGVWLPGLINGFVTMGKTASGVPSLAPSSIMQMGANIAGTLIWAGMKSALSANLLCAIAIFAGAAFVFLAFLGMTAMFMMAQVQVYLAIGFCSFFVAFGGSRWTVSYVEKLFSFCVSSGIYLMSMYLLIGGAWSITGTWKTRAANAAFATGGLIDGWIIGGSAVLYLLVVWFIARHVSAALGGSPNLSGSDATSFMGAGISTAVTAGAMMASGGTAAAATQGANIAASTLGGSAGASGLAGGSASVSPPSTGGGGSNSVAPPASSGSSVGSTAANLGRLSASVLQRMPQNGHSAPPPPLNGIGH